MVPNAPRRPSLTAHALPQMTPGNGYNRTSASPAPGVGRSTSYQQTKTSYGVSGIPQTPSRAAAHAQTPKVTPSAAHPSSYNASSTAQAFASRGPTQSQLATAQNYSHSTSYANQVSQCHPQVYVMTDAANASISLETRKQFPCDDHGRVLWFTTPPLNHTTGPVEVVSPKDGKPLSHTPEYNVAKEKRRKLIEERRRQVQERIAAENKSTGAEQINPDDDDDRQGSKRRKVTDAQVDTLVLQNLTDQILNANKEWYKSQYGDRAAQVEAYDAIRAAQRRKEVEAKAAYFEERRRREEERKERDRSMEGKVFMDDWDERH